MPKIKKQIIGDDDHVLSTEYGSGFLNHPVRVIQQFSDCLPLAYPTVTRTGFEGLTGNEDVIPFDDGKTIIFNSAHANAWVYFYGRPKDGSTIKLFDPAGSIELGDVIANPGIRQDDLSVSAPGELVRQKVYEVEIVSTEAPVDKETGNTYTFPIEDSPLLQGSWTGLKNLPGLEIDTADPYKLVLEIHELDLTGETDLNERDPGVFTVNIEGLGGYAHDGGPDGVIKIAFEMPTTLEETALVDCEVVGGVGGTIDPAQAQAILPFYEGLTITWPNPRNAIQVVETTDSITTFTDKYSGTLPTWEYRLPFPDSFRWRQSSDTALQWDDWQPSDEGRLIGSGDIKQELIIKDLRYSNVGIDGYIYSELINVSERYASLLSYPSSFSAKIYARGDLSSTNDNEYYKVEVTTNGTTWYSVGPRINELKPSQTGDYWAGLTAYAPFPDGRYFTEKDLQYVVKDDSGNPLYLNMPDDPSIQFPDAVGGTISTPLHGDSIQFRVEVGNEVSWGKCELKIVISYSGEFLGVDGIDNANAAGNNLVLSWGDFANHGVGDKWTVNVEDSTTQTFEFNRGVITNPNHTEVKVDKTVKSRDQLNSIFAKAVNESGLQIIAHHDGEKVLLEQTMPGHVGNMHIFADARAKCHVSNSKNFVLGADGAVTGSFVGGEDYLVSYPTTLPLESNWLHNQVATPNTLSADEDRGLVNAGLIVTGSTKKGVADYGTLYKEKNDAIKITPFQDTALTPDLDDEFYQAGTPKEKFEGFSSPLKSKTKITIGMPVQARTAFGFDTKKESPTSSKYQAMVYYNFATQAWEKVGPSNAGFLPSPGSEEELQAFFEDVCIGFSRGVELIQSAPQVASLPISNFGFPMHPKYNAIDDQTLSMSDYIDKPFVLEKFVVEFDAEWNEGEDFSKRSIMYDVGTDGRITRSDEDGAYNNKAAINNFFILNQRDFVGEYEYNNEGGPTTYWYPPNYLRNIEKGFDDPSKNRYMWNGADYRYIGASSLVSLFRFLPGVTDAYADDKNAVVINEIDGTRNFESGVSSTVASYPTVNRESAPWAFPAGASTDGFDSSARFVKHSSVSEKPVLQITLGDLLDIGSPVVADPPYDPGDDLDQPWQWVWSADDEINTPTSFNTYNANWSTVPFKDASVIAQTSDLLNYPGNETYCFQISNTNDDAPSSIAKKYNIRIMPTAVVAEQGQTYTIRYLFAQGSSLFDDYYHPDDRNEPPDPGMEFRDGYRSEALRFQIAKYPNNLTASDQDLLNTSDTTTLTAMFADPRSAETTEWLSRADLIDSLEWIDINIHEPDYQKQGIWQEGVAVLDQKVLFGEEHQGGYFIRFIQEGNSGWPDSWVFSDISVDTDPSFTKSLWFKPSASSTNMNLISVVDPDAVPNKFWLMIAKDGTLRLLVDSGRNRVYSKIISQDPVTDGNWHHAILTYEGASSKFNLWLDGDHIGLYEIPQGENEEGDLLWTKSRFDPNPLTETEAVITVDNLIGAGIYPPPNSSYVDANGNWDVDFPAEFEWSYTGEESVIIEGITIYLSLNEYMKRLGYLPFRPWYFNTNDYVIIGADADKGATTPFKYDNHFTGEIADIAAWNSALDGTSAKAVYNFRSGYYKKSVGSNVSLKGNIPHRFESPVASTFNLRDGAYTGNNVSISNGLISRYLINVPKLKIDVEGSNKQEPSVVGFAEYYEDSPYEPYQNAVLSGNKKYCLDLQAKSYLKLGRLREYLPQPSAFSEGGSDFSFFTWIKMPEVKENNPVIFSINDNAGKNRLIFYVDTADRIYVKEGPNAEKPLGMRLGIFVKSAPLDTTSLNTIAGDAWSDPAVNSNYNDIDIGLSSAYKVFTNNIRQGKKWEADPSTLEVDDNVWHHVGFTHTVDNGRSSFEIYFDGNKQVVHTETAWRVTGPSNDKYMLTFHDASASESAGYHPDLWTDDGGANYGGWLAPSDYASLDDRRVYKETNTASNGSRFHQPLPLQLDDRVSIGQEYDIKYRRFFFTSKTGERKYKSKRYRVASQKINARITDITVWEGALQETDVGKLYNAKYGDSTAVLHYASKHGTARDLVTYGQWCIYGSVNESSTNVNDTLELGLQRELSVVATSRGEEIQYPHPETGNPTSYDPPRYEFPDYDGDPSTKIHNAGFYKMEGTVKRPVKHESGLSYRIGSGSLPTNIRSVYKTNHNGTRTGQENDIFSPRGIFNTVPGSKVVGEYFDFGQERRGLDKSKIKVYDDYEKESPYVLLPSDKLVFGWQCSMPFDFNRVNDKGSGPHMTMLPNLASKITLYGSFISDHKEKHDPTNQNLTSGAVHEALQFEAPVHDRFHLEDIGYTAGSYIDDVVLGKMINSDALARSRGSDRYGTLRERLNRQLAGSVAEHTQGADGSCLKGVRLVDEKERFFDTVVASPADYHILNGNGILEWSSPLFDEGRKVRSIVVGEPKPSDMKIVQAEITNIACQDEGWYEPLPQGVIKLSLTRLWTADDRYGDTSLSYYNTYASLVVDGGSLATLSTEVTTETFDKVGWYIYQQRIEGMISYDGSGLFDGVNPSAADSSAGSGYFYTAQGAPVGRNYMFTSVQESVADVEPDDYRDSYITIHDANGDAHYLWLRWSADQTMPSELSGEANVHTVLLNGWQDPDSLPTNGWINLDVHQYNPSVLESANLHSSPTELNDFMAGTMNTIALNIQQYSNDQPPGDGTNPAGDDDWNAVFQPYPRNSRYMPAEVFAQKVAAALPTSMFEVLYDDTNVYWDDPDNDAIKNIYIRTIAGGLTATTPDAPEVEKKGGGIPGIHYASPDATFYLDISSYAYNINRPNGVEAISSLTYLSSDLANDETLKSNNWGVVAQIGSSNEETASLLGLSLDVPGVEQFVQNLTPNNALQFRHQYPVMEDKNGFERIAGYTLDGCFFQIHDGNDNAYNVWYKLNDGLSEVPPAPTVQGGLITVSTITPGSPSSDVAAATAEAIAEQYPQSFTTAHEQGKSFFKVENVHIGETKDADSTIMGLPLTTGFYLVDELGFEYDNESFRWAFNWGGPGFFSFSKIFSSNETYASGRTPESEEVFWHGDPIQEGNDAYHKNTNNMIDSYWLGSYPFEPKYASLFRGKFFKTDRDWLVTSWDDETGEFSETNTTTNRFFTIVITGSNIENKIVDPTLDSESEYNVLPLLGTGETNILSTYIFNRAERDINTQFLKFYFGSGNTWQKNPELERVMLYSDGYDWPSYVPRIRGWKYGLLSALPSNTTAVYRHDSFGQFRDMLEQRADARFYKTLTRGRFKGRSYPSAATVRVRFVDDDGRLTRPEKTWSQNLSTFCTSSLPFFDDGTPRNREEIDPSKLNTSLGIIED